MICDSLAAAYTYLRIEEIPFDRLYLNVFHKPDDESAYCDLCEHFYFNDGDNITSAYYNVRTKIVTVLKGGRPDSTPERNRQYLQLIEAKDAPCAKTPEAYQHQNPTMYPAGNIPVQDIGKAAPSASTLTDPALLNRSSLNGTMNSRT